MRSRLPSCASRCTWSVPTWLRRSFPVAPQFRRVLPTVTRGGRHEKTPDHQPVHAPLVNRTLAFKAEVVLAFQLIARHRAPRLALLLAGTLVILLLAEPRPSGSPEI